MAGNYAFKPAATPAASLSMRQQGDAIAAQTLLSAANVALQLQQFALRGAPRIEIGQQ